MKTDERIFGALCGAAVGDALGVPVEFSSRSSRQKDPVVDMRAYGTWSQPAGTWSDDTSMSLCLTQSLITHGFDLEEQGILYASWLLERLWTPHGTVFDVGGTCASAIRRFDAGARPSGLNNEHSNGNGSLMRTLPLSIWLARKNLNVEEIYALTGDASAITHAHPRSRLGCALHAFFVRRILNGESRYVAHEGMRQDLVTLVKLRPDLKKDSVFYDAACNPDLFYWRDPKCRGDGYVVNCLQAALWAVLSSSSYREATLKAVNLGDDTDTTACVAGGLAGLVFGLDAIPKEWIKALARSEDLGKLFVGFVKTL